MRVNYYMSLAFKGRGIVLFLIAVMFCTAHEASAQKKRSFSDLTWYNIKTQVPTGLKLVQNTVDMIELTDKTINCKLFRFERTQTSDEMVAQTLLDYANDLDVDIKKSALESIVDDDFAGAQIIGRMPNGNNLILCGLVGLETSTSYAIIIEYTDAVSHADAIYITDSFELDK